MEPEPLDIIRKIKTLYFVAAAGADPEVSDELTEKAWAVAQHFIKPVPQFDEEGEFEGLDMPKSPVNLMFKSRKASVDTKDG